MQMNVEALQELAAWESVAVTLPQYDVPAMVQRTKENPIWVHFGAGNIFRGFIAVLQQQLLNQKLSDCGIIAAETFDYDIIDKIYAPYDNLTMNVTLNADATTSCEIVASVAQGLKASDTARLSEIFKNPSLQMVSYTITEKGYALRGTDGEFLPIVKTDMEAGPQKAVHAMSITAALLYERYQAGGFPLAVVSMDNCSHNGEKLRASVLDIAGAWVEKGHVAAAFLTYLKDENKVSFPWSMIDKITPRPAEAVEVVLAQKGITEMQPIITSKNTYIAPFVNAERPQYLVVEDKFPNGRPPLEKAGVYLTDRDTVNNAERMKVTTCLNPLHTAMSVYGCLLGYTLISAEMKDEDLVALVKRLGYIEGLPVVTDPHIFSPRAFIDEVVNERLPNPFMPDAPQRIATDTSQKVGIRFGETIKSYLVAEKPLDELIAIPLAIAGWMRYLLGIDDLGNVMEVSADPLKEELQQKLSAIVWDAPESYTGQLNNILNNESIFGLDLTKTALAKPIEQYFVSMLNGKNSVRETLHTALSK